MTLPACSSPELPPDISDTVLIAEKAPPPLSGGTLLVTTTGKAVAADPDRDKVWLVDLTTKDITSIKLSDGDEPGRAVEDSAGRIHVALRSGGGVATIDPASGKLLRTTAVCPAPRGLAYDKASDVLHVACNGGELVTLPAAGGDPVRSLRLERDIRDIAISGDKLLVSRFRSAELLAIDSKGTVLNRQQPPALGDPNSSGFEGVGQSFSPTGAFRLASLPNGGVMMVHQRSLTSTVIVEQPGGYGGGDKGGCDGSIVHPTVTSFDKNGNPVATPGPIIPQSVLPLDVAVDSDGKTMAMVAAGSNKVILSPTSRFQDEPIPGSGSCAVDAETLSVPGEPIAVAFWNGKLIAQTREPATIQFLSDKSTPPLFLPDAKSVADTGHDLFHKAASETSAIACASCHLEGHDDSHVWNFDTVGARRTQSMGGDISKTAPFHWDGDMDGLPMIMTEVFVNRMGGQVQGPRHINALSGWMNQIPVLPRSPSGASESAIQHGSELFAKSGCASCHSGDMLTNNTNQDVGTGKALQVPSLIGVANRAPFLHDGCAATLTDRFGACGGGDKHGTTSNLTKAELSDLVDYLETL